MARELTALAMDGKCARGARRSTPENVPNAGTAENPTGPGSGQAPMFLAAVTHDRPMVVAQRQIPTKTSESAVWRPCSRTCRPSAGTSPQP